MAREPLKVLTESMFYVLLSLLRQERCGTEIVRMTPPPVGYPWGQGRCTRFWQNFRRRA